MREEIKAPRLEGYKEGEMIILVLKRKGSKWIGSQASIVPKASLDLIKDSVMEALKQVEKKYHEN